MDEREIYVQVDEEVYSKPSFPVLKIFKNNWIIALILAVVISAFFVVYAFAIKKPTYTASCDVILKLSLDDELGYSNEQVVTNNTTLAKNYLMTIKDVISSPKTAVRASSYNDYSINAGNISVGVTEGSLIMSIRYTDLDANVVVGKLKDVVNASEQELMAEKILVATEISLQEIDDYTVIKNGDKSKYVIMGVALGVVLGVAVATIKYFAFDNKREKSSQQSATEQ